MTNGIGNVGMTAFPALFEPFSRTKKKAGYTQVNAIKGVEIRVEKPLFYPLWFAFQSGREYFPM